MTIQIVRPSKDTVYEWTTGPNVALAIAGDKNTNINTYKCTNTNTNSGNPYQTNQRCINQMLLTKWGQMKSYYFKRRQCALRTPKSKLTCWDWWLRWKVPTINMLVTTTAERTPHCCWRPKGGWQQGVAYHTSMLAFVREGETLA